MQLPRHTLAELVRRQHRWNARAAEAETAAAAGPAAAAGRARLAEVAGFGANPGALRMLVHLPRRLAPGAPLVVALHGCTQSAAAYDRGSGWSDLADRFGFALLLPEQRRENNAHLCLNWFQPGDAARGAGEALSIRRMVEHMLAGHGLDRSRVFITGLSAGGAMTATMLAAYPEVFAAGAILAGLPHGSARDVREAFEAMSAGRPRPAREWGDLVRRASPHRGPWPRVSVWHGAADATVRPENAAEIVKQWTDVHGLGGVAPVRERIGAGHVRQVWRGLDGAVLVESHSIAGMAHGVPIHPGEGPERCGAAGAHAFDVGVSSTHRIAEFWGLAPAEGWRGRAAATAAEGAPPTPRAAFGRTILVGATGETRISDAPAPPPRPEAAGGGSGAAIRRALVAAGLMEP